MNYKVSIVITTIGEKYLKNVLDSIESSSIRPIEIIIVCPKDYETRLDFLDKKKHTLITTQKKQQVFQRSKGFQISKGDYILQLDSDIVIYRDTILELINSINSENLNCASFPFYDHIKLKNNYLKKLIFFFFIKRETSLKNWDSWFFGFNETLNLDNLFCKYAPGGCVMHYKKNLIFNDYYGFDGKAYAEDILHSYYLFKKNTSIKFSIKARVKAISSIDYKFYSYKDLKFYILRVIKIKKFIINDSKGNKLIFFIWKLYFILMNIRNLRF